MSDSVTKGNIPFPVTIDFADSNGAGVARVTLYDHTTARAVYDGNRIDFGVEHRIIESGIDQFIGSIPDNGDRLAFKLDIPRDGSQPTATIKDPADPDTAVISKNITFKKGKGKKMALTIGIVGAVALISAIALAMYFKKGKRKRR